MSSVNSSLTLKWNLMNLALSLLNLKWNLISHVIRGIEFIWNLNNRSIISTPNEPAMIGINKNPQKPTIVRIENRG